MTQSVQNNPESGNGPQGADTAWSADLARDLRLAWRGLCRTPGFTCTVILSLALGLALITIMFAIANAYLVRALPYPAGDRLYHVRYAPMGTPEPGDMGALDWNALPDVVEAADHSVMARLFIGRPDDRLEVQGLAVDSAAMAMIGLRAGLGHLFRPGDFRPGSEPVALIGDALWHQRFGADSSVIGRSFEARRSNLEQPVESFRIIGVLPPDFHWVREQGRGAMEFAVPLRERMTSYLIRLRPGIPVGTAEARITDFVRRSATSFPDQWTGVRLESVRERYLGEVRATVVALTAAAGLVFLIVCVNVGVLLLLRALRRQRDAAIRVALGAGYRHLLRWQLAESGLLCGCALIAGLALAALGTHLLSPLIQSRLGREVPGGMGLRLDAVVVIAACLAALLAALTFASLPVLAPWRRRLAETLQHGSRNGTDAPLLRRLRSTLVAAEIAASLSLVVGCGLMIRTVLHLTSTDLGYRTTGIMRSRIALPPRAYPDSSTFLPFFDQLRERLGSDPEASIALTNFIPLYPTPLQAVEAEQATGAVPPAGVIAVSDGYFGMFDIPVLSGRAFTPRDRAGSEPVALISQTLARHLWPGQNPIGRRIRSGEDTSPNGTLGQWRTVIGVVSDVRQVYTDTDLNDIYLPFYQVPSRYAPLYVRSIRPDSYWTRHLAETVASIDSQVQFSPQAYLGNSLSAEADRQLAGPRFLGAVLTGFAAFAALLALIGIYGVTGYSVQQREREVAIRMALGADGPAVVALFLRKGVPVLLAGLGLGLAGSVAIGRLLAGQLFGVGTIDTPTLLAASISTGLLGLVATWWPARRATRVSPAATLSEQ